MGERWVKTVQVGDIIRCPDFAYGAYRLDDVREGRQGDITISSSKTISHRITVANTGISYETSAHDPTRGQRLFAVTRAVMKGGGYAMFNDRYPDALHVTAVALDNPLEVIHFTLNTNSYNTAVAAVVLVQPAKAPGFYPPRHLGSERIIMDDVSNGRINCEHLTRDEWALLERLALKPDGWFVPDDTDWLVVRGLLALVDIRRGYKDGPDEVGIQFGWPHLRLNEHGQRALDWRDRGRVYTAGKPSTFAQAVHHPAYVWCAVCGGQGCEDCDRNGYVEY